MGFRDHSAATLEIQMQCALRFDGYRFEQARGLEVPGVTGGGLASLAVPMLRRFEFEAGAPESFAVFFYLQRLLFKGGGDRLDRTVPEWCVFDHLFLSLHPLPVPAAFRFEPYATDWQCLNPARIALAAGEVRRSFRRVGRATRSKPEAI